MPESSEAGEKVHGSFPGQFHAVIPLASRQAISIDLLAQVQRLVVPEGTDQVSGSVAWMPSELTL